MMRLAGQGFAIKSTMYNFFVRLANRFMHSIPVCKYFSPLPDADECSDGDDDCHSNADCTNIPGSFTCACSSGYTGDGQTCTGKIIQEFHTCQLKKRQ